MSYVVAIGADYVDGDDSGNIEITYQVALPVKITGEANETGKSTFTTYTVVAPSLRDANSYINAISSKKLDLSHTSLIVYSEELASKGLEGHVNSLISNVSIRPRTIVTVCKGKAKDFLENVTPVLETSPARYYELLLSSFNYTSKSAGTEIIDFYNASQSLNVSPIMAYCILDDNNEAVFSGLAVFKGLKMVGKIEEDDVIGHLILTNSLGEGIITIRDDEDKSKITTITIKDLKNPNIKVEINDGIPLITAEIIIDAHLDSNGSPTNYFDNKNKEQLNKKIEEEVKNKINKYIDKTIELNADSVGFGRYAKINYLTWEDFCNINWKDIYNKAKFNITVKSNLNVSQIVSHSVPTIEK